MKLKRATSNYWWCVLTSVNIPNLDATIVEACCQEQLILSKLEAMPLNVDTAAVLFWYWGTKGQSPDNITTIYGVFRGLACRWDYLTTIAALTRQMPRAQGIGTLFSMAHWTTAKKRVEKEGCQLWNMVKERKWKKANTSLKHIA